MDRESEWQEELQFQVEAESLIPLVNTWQL